MSKYVKIYRNKSPWNYTICFEFRNLIINEGYRYYELDTVSHHLLCTFYVSFRSFYLIAWKQTEIDSNNFQPRKWTLKKVKL